MANRAQVRYHATAEPYEYTNEVINKYLDDEKMFVVQGPFGRVPVFAETADAAVDRYLEKFSHRLTEESDTLENECYD